MSLITGALGIACGVLIVVTVMSGSTWYQKRKFKHEMLQAQIWLDSVRRRLRGGTP